MTISNVAKYQIKEIFNTIFYFSIITLLLIRLNNVEDFPLLRSFVAAIFISLSVAFFEIVVIKKIQSYIRTSYLLLISIVYYIIIFFFMLVSFIYIDLIFKQNLPWKEVVNTNILEMIPLGIHNAFFYLFVFLTVRFLILQIKSRTLQGITKKYFFGKPGLPIKDTKIFMFMDLVSSTSYAEKLGYFKYSKFIKDIYKEIDEYVLATDGIIYQYVGDEIVIVWSIKDGIKNNNCIRFFYLFKNRIDELESYFVEQYGIKPAFKAAFHYGDVAVSEIGGVLRRDIAFHGDTVNTTARICSKCKELDERILVSGSLVNKLSANNGNINFEPVGKFNLKGKKDEIELYRVNNSMPPQELQYV